MSMGQFEQVAGKIEKLKAICGEVGRSFEEIEIATWYIPEMGLTTAPDDFLAMGIRNIIHLQRGPGWDLGIVRELLQWRDNLA